MGVVELQGSDQKGGQTPLSKVGPQRNHQPPPRGDRDKGHGQLIQQTSCFDYSVNDFGYGADASPI